MNAAYESLKIRREMEFERARYYTAAFPRATNPQREGDLAHETLDRAEKLTTQMVALLDEQGDS